MARESGDGISPRLIGAGLIAALALVFVFQNTAEATVNLLWTDVSAPGWIWMLLLFLAGVVAGSIFPWFSRKPK